MSAPKSSKAYSPLWERLFELAYERRLVRVFNTLDAAKKFQREGNYYRAARRSEDAAMRKVGDLIPTDGEQITARGNWLNLAERVSIMVRPLPGGLDFEVIMENKMDSPTAQALAEMIAEAEGDGGINPLDPTQALTDKSTVEGYGKEDGINTEEEEGSESGIPDMYRTGQD